VKRPMITHTHHRSTVQLANVQQQVHTNKTASLSSSKKQVGSTHKAYRRRAKGAGATCSYVRLDVPFYPLIAWSKATPLYHTTASLFHMLHPDASLFHPDARLNLSLLQFLARSERARYMRIESEPLFSPTRQCWPAKARTRGTRKALHTAAWPPFLLGSRWCPIHVVSVRSAEVVAPVAVDGGDVALPGNPRTLGRDVCSVGSVRCVARRGS
jgi:hypothetical protein